MRENLMPVIRPPRQEDAEQIADLAGQLGYPATPDQIRQRLAAVESDDGHAVFVAEQPGIGVIAWIHVHVSKSLASELRAEIAGLVVDRDYHGSGIGRRLVEQAEQWARRQGCSAVTVRSNVIRAEAHTFYEIVGYANTKTQYAFHKPL